MSTCRPVFNHILVFYFTWCQLYIIFNYCDNTHHLKIIHVNEFAYIIINHPCEWMINKCSPFSDLKYQFKSVKIQVIKFSKLNWTHLSKTWYPNAIPEVNLIRYKSDWVWKLVKKLRFKYMSSRYTSHFKIKIFFRVFLFLFAFSCFWNALT